MENFSAKWEKMQWSKFDQKKLGDTKKILSQRSATKKILTFDMRSPKDKLWRCKKNQDFNLFYENRAVYSKISEISKRSILYNTLSPPTGPKSLNFNIRKHTHEQILKENKLILKKIQEKKSSLSNSAFKKDYEKTVKIKNLISKKNFFIKKKIFQLPTLELRKNKLKPTKSEPILFFNGKDSTTVYQNISTLEDIEEKPEVNESFLRMTESFCKESLNKSLETQKLE